MSNKVLHQVIDSVSSSDAVSDHAFLIQDWLHDLGYESEILVGRSDPGLKRRVRQFAPRLLPKNQHTIYHHSTGSHLVDPLIARRVPLIMIYQNVTPPAFYQSADPALARNLARGREQLAKVKPYVKLALGASSYSESELRSLGFEQTGVLPLVFNKDDYNLAHVQNLKKSSKEGPLLLFLGRIAPNKRQEDLVKLLFYLRRIVPDARLALVGGQNDKGYLDWLRFFVNRLALGKAVEFAGHVGIGEIANYYHSADLFVSMSEHEGFCKPLIESMYFELPILAYASSAVPSTLGESGILFGEKDFEALAELADLMIHNQSMRQHLVDGQNQRLQDFLEPSVRRQFQQLLKLLDLI